MKKLVVLLVVGIMVLALAAPVFAHPPHAEGEAGKANANAKFGLHRACEAVSENSNGRAAHVLAFWVGPHAPEAED